ncbi:MAG: hypothetical protein IPQ18_02195 [Saprospiraceae bacterium]|jgi:triacylglycerol esterase/lipase EstA (alpha/beta hydrolase family)|nr:hypothetical protein [Saprospiraceae bacterium]
MKNYNKFVYLVALIIFATVLKAQNTCNSNFNTILGTSLHHNEDFISPPASPPMVFPNRVDTNNKRLVIWMHGLAGDKDSWVRTSDAVFAGDGTPEFKGWKVAKYDLTHNQISIRDAALNSEVELGTAVNTFNVNNANSPNIPRTDHFIIAHSQGGLIARRMDQLYQDDPIKRREFGGIITFGTPHRGALIQNNVGELKKFAIEGAKALAAGPIEYGIEASVLDWVTSGESISGTVNSFVEGFLPKAADLVAEGLEAQIGNDYQISSDPTKPINVLNTYTPTYPHVAYYGDESDAPHIWGVLEYLFKHKPNTFPHWKAEDETNRPGSLVQIMDTMRIEYYVKTHAFSILGKYDRRKRWTAWEQIEENVFSYFPWIVRDTELYDFIDAAWDDRYENWFGLSQAWRIGANEARKIGYAYEKGYNWLTTCDEQFRTLTGALTYTFEVVGQGYECKCFDEFGQTTSILQNPNDCTGGCELSDYFEIMGWKFNHIQSDGIVPAWSAGDFIGATHPARFMPGSNHQQMRNDGNTRKAMIEIFGGNVGGYFWTKPR